VSQENSQPICAMPTLNKLQCPLVHAYIGTKEINDANKGKYQGRGSKPKEIFNRKEGKLGISRESFLVLYATGNFSNAYFVIISFLLLRPPTSSPIYDVLEWKIRRVKTIRILIEYYSSHRLTFFSGCIRRFNEMGKL
jgi:hypothetical protein